MSSNSNSAHSFYGLNFFTRVGLRIFTRIFTPIFLLAFFFTLLFVNFSASALVYGKRVHALALYGKAKHKKGFSHFSYADPRAVKGGKIVLGVQGGFDSFNPYSLKGRTAAGLGLLFESLTEAGGDEVFTRYGRLASSMRLSASGDSITFYLHPKARWHDGSPVLAEDVLFSFRSALSESASPIYRQYYAGLLGMEKSGDRAVTFRFAKGNRELPLILGELPIVAVHDWKERDIASTTLEPPLGSGPYRIGDFEAGRTLRYLREKDYWGKDEGFARGAYNFDEIRYDDYRDANVIVEALKAGKLDFRSENSSKAWAVSYEGEALRSGRLIKRLVPLDLPQGMQGYVFNLRRDIFTEAVLREAIAYAFDFVWSNKTLFYGQYKRTRSYFDNSMLAARGLPTGEELKLLEEYRERFPKSVPARVFTEPYEPPSSDGMQRGLRKNLQLAMNLLRDAGYKTVDGELFSPSGKAVTFELLLFDPLQERIALPFAKNLQRLGITMRVRTVDAAQYVSRLEKFDFDMVVSSWGQSLTPGNEQRAMWTSQASKTSGSRNYSGLRNSAVDDLVEKIVVARDRTSLTSTVRALDRILQWHFLVVPHFHISSARIVYWDRFGIPSYFPTKAAPSVFYWWSSVK